MKLVTHKNGGTFIFSNGSYTKKNQFVQSHGYPATSFRGRPYLVHRLVAKGYVRNLQSKTQVNHLNGNRLDSRAENLEWVSPAENIQHAYSVLGRRSNRNTGKGCVFWETQSGKWRAKITRDGRDRTKTSSDKSICLSWLESQNNGL